MNRTRSKCPHTFWTTFSLKAPVAQATHPLGPHLVDIWAQSHEAVSTVTLNLTRTYGHSNAHNIHAVVKRVVDDAENQALPLRCRIVEKAALGL